MPWPVLLFGFTEHSPIEERLHLFNLRLYASVKHTDVKNHTYKEAAKQSGAHKQALIDEVRYLIAVSSSYLMRQIFPDRFRGYKLSFPSMARLRWRGERDYHSFSLTAAAARILLPTNVLCEASHFCASERDTHREKEVGKK